LNYAHSSKLNSSKPVDCENCAILQSKVSYLISTASKVSMGTTNLNALLGSQNCAFEKADIGYQAGPNGKQKLFNNFLKVLDQSLHNLLPALLYEKGSLC